MQTLESVNTHLSNYWWVGVVNEIEGVVEGGWAWLARLKKWQHIKAWLEKQSPVHLVLHFLKAFASQTHTKAKLSDTIPLTTPNPAASWHTASPGPHYSK